VGQTYARFRFSTAGWLDPCGPADDGEVEDYMVVVRECFPFWYSTYSDWVAYGRPLCWCNSAQGGTGDYQCDGDADGFEEGLFVKYRVWVSDLGMLISNWMKQMGDPTLNPCADIDHKEEGLFVKYRVYTADLGILINNWMKTSAQLPGDCPRPE
jgi:hypothetical protein